MRIFLLIEMKFANLRFVLQRWLEILQDIAVQVCGIQSILAMLSSMNVPVLPNQLV